MPQDELHVLEPYLEPGVGQVKTIAALGVVEAAPSARFREKVLALLSVKDAAIRRAALRAAGNLPGEEVEAPLLARLEDPIDEVRIEAVEVLVRRDCRRAIPTLLGLLETEDLVRYHVIRALGRLRAGEAAETLRELFPGAPAHEQIEIVAALHRIAPPWLPPFLKECLVGDNPEVRRLAADGLVRSAGPQELPLLLSMALDEDWSFRNLAAWGLGRLALEEGRETLVSLSRDPEPLVARTARDALRKLRQP
jgi:HEAT repeat protein